MRDDPLAGWYANKLVVGQCARCAWRLTDHVMSSCEYGLPAFPAARFCGRFEPEVPDAPD